MSKRAAETALEKEDTKKSTFNEECEQMFHIHERVNVPDTQITEVFELDVDSSGSEGDPSSPVLTNKSDFLERFFGVTDEPYFFEDTDVPVLEVTDRNDLPDSMAYYSPAELSRSIFARNLRSYPNGTRVEKHCRPWGSNQVLRGNVFVLKRKFVSVDGDMRGAIISSTDVGVDLYVPRDFLEGWTGEMQRKEYAEFHHKKM